MRPVLTYIGERPMAFALVAMWLIANLKGWADASYVLPLIAGVAAARRW